MVPRASRCLRDQAMTQTKADAGTFASKVQQLRTPAGLEVWLVEDYAVPLLALDFSFAGGSSQDPADKEGVATMLSALLDEGAGPYDAEAFHEALDDKAVEISFSAERDNFQGRLKTLIRNLEPGFDLLRLAVNEPHLAEDALERKRAQVLAGLRRDAKDPDALVGRAFRQAAFPGHAYGRASRGSLEGVARITRDDVVALHRAIFARSGLKIAAVGAIDAVTLGPLVDSVFANLKPQGALVPVPEIAMSNLGQREIIDLDVPQSTIRFGLPGIPRKDPDHMAGVVVNHILGGGVFSARLFKEVREKRGLAYSVHSQLATLDHTAMFSGGTSTKNERAAESLAVIEEEIAKMAADGPTAEELDKAKKYLTGSYALRFDSSTKIASQLVHLQTEDFPVDYLDRRNAEIEAVTLDDAKRVSKRLFEGKKLLVAVAGKPTGM